MRPDRRGAVTVRRYPPGYPREYERRVQLQDGRSVWVRPILPTDGPQLRAAFRTADPDTLHRRFLGAPPRVTQALIAYLTTVDYHRRFAIVATDPCTDDGVAIGRYEPLAPGIAEIAVVVDPVWRRVGLATALVEILAEAALHNGVREVRASYLADNQPVTHLLDDTGVPTRQMISRGIADVAVALQRSTSVARSAGVGAGFGAGDG